MVTSGDVSLSNELELLHYSCVRVSVSSVPSRTDMYVHRKCKVEANACLHLPIFSGDTWSCSWGWHLLTDVTGSEFLELATALYIFLDLERNPLDMIAIALLLTVADMHLVVINLLRIPVLPLMPCLLSKL